MPFLNPIKSELFQDVFYTCVKVIPDRLFIKLKYRRMMGKWPDLLSPQSYNEKLQWMKLNYHNKKEALMADKYEVREYVKSTIGDEYLIPIIGVWDNVSEIPFEELPKSFVMKCTHDSGSVVICKDKSHFDWNKAANWLNKRLKQSGSDYGREWNYRQIKPRIVVEEYMSELDDQIKDYKFFCFDGKPVMLFVGSDRFKGVKFDFYDIDFNHLDIINGHPQNIYERPEKPQNYELMVELAERLSAGIPHVRVDLYNIEGKIFFGEMTFSHFSGFTPFEPEKWDYYLGNAFKLPEVLK